MKYIIMFIILFCKLIVLQDTLGRKALTVIIN